MTCDLQRIAERLAALQCSAVEADTLEETSYAIHLGSHQRTAHAADFIHLCAGLTAVAEDNAIVGQCRLGGILRYRAQACTQLTVADGRRRGQHAVVSSVQTDQRESTVLTAFPDAAVRGNTHPCSQAATGNAGILSSQHRRIRCFAGRLADNQQIALPTGNSTGDEYSAQHQHQGATQCRYPSMPRTGRSFLLLGGLMNNAVFEICAGIQSGKTTLGGFWQTFDVFHRASPPFKMVSNLLRPRDKRLEMVPSGRCNISAISVIP